MRKIRNLMATTNVTVVVVVTLGLLVYGYLFHVSYWLHPQRYPIIPQAKDSPFQRVTITTDDDLTLIAWYVPSQNGQAILTLHGHSANCDQHMPHASYLLEDG